MKSTLFALATLFLNFRLLIAAAPDSFKLVVVWPNTFCLTEPCQLRPQVFTLHDLKHSKFEESNAFWKYEWNKHGTCSGKSPADYLNLVFALQKTYDVKQIYAQNSILPNDQQAYKGEQFGRAIFNKIKLWTEIECKLMGPDRYLFQIFVCISAQGQFKNCSSGGAVYRGCTKFEDVKFPPPPASVMVSSDELEKRRT
ncbi:hypothetical protein M0R45_028066 [Rubus argutus]|uniref:Uncharacterized protein n=1 Tax=Rubus argutus TaxID=59490 RepID=A0AAW1W6E1_RUBAR